MRLKMKFGLHPTLRVTEAKEELHRMLGEDELREAVVLVFANKQVCSGHRKLTHASLKFA
jgi:hypothetical protein